MAIADTHFKRSSACICPVVIRDVNAFALGNGTQDIFYDRGDVFFASIHADPASDYPYFWGFADETGAGDGDGATFNQPLPRKTTWAEYGPALERALEAITRFGAKTLIVSSMALIRLSSIRSRTSS